MSTFVAGWKEGDPIPPKPTNDLEPHYWVYLLSPRLDFNTYGLKQTGYHAKKQDAAQSVLSLYERCCDSNFVYGCDHVIAVVETVSQYNWRHIYRRGFANYGHQWLLYNENRVIFIEKVPSEGRQLLRELKGTFHIPGMEML